jgi:hypothetical protein
MVAGAAWVKTRSGELAHGLGEALAAAQAGAQTPAGTAVAGTGLDSVGGEGDQPGVGANGPNGDHGTFAG